MDKKFETPRMETEVMPDPEQLDVEETAVRRVAVMAVAGRGAVIENVVQNPGTESSNSSSGKPGYYGGTVDRPLPSWQTKPFGDYPY